MRYFLSIGGIFFLMGCLLLWGNPSQLAFAQTSTPLLTRADEYFQKGEYENALPLYEMALKTNVVEGTIGASLTWTMLGQYAKAEKIYRDALKTFPQNPHLLSQLANILVQTGNSGEALRILKGVVQQSDPSIRSLVTYGQLLQLRGQREEAIPYFEKAIDAYNQGKVSLSEELAQVAVAGWILEHYHDANHLFREIIQVAPDNLEAQVLWGDLFLEKYNQADAQLSYREVLKQNERYVPALVGMAKTLPESGAKQLLEQALSVNENSLAALDALAEIYIEAGHFEEAKAYLNQALGVNSESLTTKTLLAAIAYLEDNHTEFAQIEKEILQFSPGNSQFYTKIAEMVGRKYRFVESVELARQAVKLNPQDWKGYTVLGMNLLRLGEEEEGRIHLERSFQKDPFNVWTMNMLKVLDVLSGYERKETENFIVKLSQKDAKVLWPHLEPFLNKAWMTLTKKYNFVPEKPVLIEIFEKHEDFAVRTSGLPNIGPLVGVCFGKVITLDSPSALKSFANWQEIVWHEFVHVITLQMSKNRLPRWLSEGVSVFEEHQGQPEWGRKQDLDLVKAFNQGKILNMHQLVESFSKATSAEELNFAYYQSFLVVEYIVEHYGFESLKRLIYQYGTVNDMEEIFWAVLKQSLSKFNEDFLNWIEKRVQTINVYVHQDDPNDQGDSHGHGMRRNKLASYEAWNEEVLLKIMHDRVQAQPRDFLAHFQLGILLYRAKDHEGAIKHLEIAKQLIPEYGAYPSPHQMLANLYRERGEESLMLRELKDLVQFQQHEFDTPYQLAKVAHQENKLTEAIYYLERVLAVNPYHLDVHMRLAEIAVAQADHETAIREYEILTFLDTADPAHAHTNLAGALLRAGKRGEAKKQALIALEIAPTYEQAQEILLDSLEAK